MTSSTLFASSPGSLSDLRVERISASIPSDTRNILVLTRDSPKKGYSNYFQTKGQGLTAFRQMINSDMAEACRPAPACVINLPSSMNYTDNRITANDHAGTLFDEVIDLAQELKLKASQWDAYNAGQKVAGKPEPNDLFTANPESATRIYMDEAIRRYLDLKLRNGIASILRAIKDEKLPAKPGEQELVNDVDANGFVSERQRQINNLVHGADLEMDITLYNMRTSVIDSRHPATRRISKGTLDGLFNLGFERTYCGLTRAGAEFLLAQRSTERRALRHIKFINMFATYSDEEMEQQRKGDPECSGPEFVKMRKTRLEFADYAAMINDMAARAARGAIIDNNQWLWLQTKSFSMTGRCSYREALNGATQWIAWKKAHQRQPWGPVGNLVDMNGELNI